MLEVFKTVLILSLFGFGITAILLCLKPITAKKFPAAWQYYAWVAVLLSMILPVYKLIPPKEVQKLPIIPENELVQTQNVQNLEEAPGIVTVEPPIADREIRIAPNKPIKLMALLAYIWFCGMCCYLAIVFGSYVVYITRKHKNSTELCEHSLWNEVKRELKIKRKIKLLKAGDQASPMLIGVLFPMIYIPEREISEESMRMVFRHELMHYKRKDLWVKWLSLFVNAVHWFNPLAYALCANISEACEVSCDMAVTKHMSEEEQKLYMKTILELAQ